MPYKYHCFNTECREKCQFCDNKGDIILDEQNDNYICPNDPVEKLKELGSTGFTVISAYKMDKQQIHKERKERSKNHFEREVMPYLPKEEQVAFIKKGYKNK